MNTEKTHTVHVPPEPVELLRAEDVSKRFGNVISLDGVSMRVNEGEVTCVLGDNGAGKSTLIKILSGVHEPDSGELYVNGKAERFTSPRVARDHGIATVFQDLATVPLMSVWRNFFIGSEPLAGIPPFRRIDKKKAKAICSDELLKMGIDIEDMEQPIGTLSGGQRQAVSIARAVYFGARVLILDEPTSALGVKQSGVVLRYIAQARDRGIGVVFITHNPHHAYPLGDRFVVLNHGKVSNAFEAGERSKDELIQMMAGGGELDSIAHELSRPEGRRPGPAVHAVAE